jgi:hypothetical protein
MNHRYLVILVEVFPLLSDRFLLFLRRVFVVQSVCREAGIVLVGIVLVGIVLVGIAPGGVIPVWFLGGGYATHSSRRTAADAPQLPTHHSRCAIASALLIGAIWAGIAPGGVIPAGAVRHPLLTFENEARGRCVTPC